MWVVWPPRQVSGHQGRCFPRLIILPEIFWWTIPTIAAPKDPWEYADCWKPYFPRLWHQWEAVSHTWSSSWTSFDGKETSEEALWCHVSHGCGTRIKPRTVGPLHQSIISPGTKTVDPWPKTMGWTRRPASTFVNVVPAKGTIVNVKLSMAIYKCCSVY